MEYLEKNLAILQEFRPDCYQMIQKVLEEKEYSFDNLETVETRDGNQALVIKRDDNQVRLNSTYRPLQEAKKWADQYEFRNMSITVLMFGIGNGFFVREMLSRLQEDAEVYLYEPDKATFLYVLHHFDMSDIFTDARVLLFIEGINEEEFSHTFNGKLHWSSIPTQIPCVHPGYDKLYHQKHIWFMAIIKRADEIELVNRDTMMAMSHSITLNVIKNLHFIKESNYSSEFIEDIPKGVPIIIVSAGPSLDKNIDELRRAEGKAFILVTDTAVKYLLARDIPFDAMVTIDAKKAMVHLKDERCADIPLFCVPEARNMILERHTGRKIWFEGLYYVEELYKKFHREFPQYNTGGSVATAAMMAGLSLGFERFVLIGQDLAYGNGATHAGNVTKRILNEDSGMEMVEGIDGNMVRSRYDWVIYRDWFEKVIEAKPEIEVIDATEGGALIHGSKVMTLAEVIDTYCQTECHMRQIIEEKPYTFSGKEYEEVKKVICHLEKDFNNIKQKAIEGKKAINELSVKIHSGQSTPALESKYVKIIKKANNFIEKQDAYPLFDAYISDLVTESLQKINCITGDATKDMLFTLEASKVVFNALLDAVKDLEPVLKESLAKL